MSNIMLNVDGQVLLNYAEKLSVYCWHFILACMKDVLEYDKSELYNQEVNDLVTYLKKWHR